MIQQVSEIDGGDFRHVLGHFPTGVVAITSTCPDGRPAGLVIGSFTSVSLDPPLVGFFPQKTSTSWPRIRDAGAFCINILGHDQEDLGRRFAVSGGDKFADLEWRRTPSGHPVLPRVPAWIDCVLAREDDAGDHWMVLAKVTALSADPGRGGPLVFYKGGYAKLAES
ncbi:flavin reductase family protein [Amycolatopsis ultiminotia]|uniref:Flavin reductase family protein n=1 Tax=Amycolatopsis ultiminotia TaxID=543629 RepID=A0ABP6UXN3_9PSEU